MYRKIVLHQVIQFIEIVRFMYSSENATEKLHNCSGSYFSG